MASLRVSGLDGIVQELARLGDETDAIAEEMLMAGAEEVKRAWQEVADERGHRQTGAMIESVGFARKPRRTGDMLSIDISPQGKDARGVRNAEKAFILHYGTSRNRGDRWVDEAEKRAEETSQAAMEAIWDKHMKG